MTSTKNRTRFAKKSDYNEIRALWNKTFEEDSPAWRDWYFKYIYKPENCIILKSGDKTVSMSHINPYPMMLNHKRIPSAALAGIATEEAERGKGYAALLIKESLNEMRKRGISFSFLYPFEYDFYRKYGYEQCYENKVYTAAGTADAEIDLIQMDENAQTAGIYAKYTKNLNGFVVRNADYQKIKLLEHFADGNKAYLVKGKSGIPGYAMVQEREGKAVLGELICDDPVNAAKALAGKIKKPVEFTSPYVLDGLAPTVKPHCMGRVTDVAGVFDGIAAKSGEMVVRVSDGIIAQNNGSFLFSAKDGKLKISKTDTREDISVDIKELGPAATGYAETMGENAQRIYNAFFGKKMPWIAEVC